MATLYTDVANVQNAPHVGDALNKASMAYGKVRVVQALIVLAAAAIGDLINVCKLRRGDVVIPDSQFMNAALGASTTLQLGDTDPAGADDDRYIPAASTAAAATVKVGHAAIANLPFEVTGDCWLQAKVGGAAATGRVVFTILIARAGA